MSETKVPEIDEVSKAPDDETLYAMYRGHEYCEDGLRAVYNAGVESLAIENARLKAELVTALGQVGNWASLNSEAARIQDESEKVKLELATARVRISNQDALLVNCRANSESLQEQLNAANRRLTALLDEAEEARHLAIERGEAAEMREDRNDD